MSRRIVPLWRRLLLLLLLLLPSRTTTTGRQVFSPRFVAVNRGNHEAFGMGVHGFTHEALSKYDMATFDMFQHCFKLLPLVRCAPLSPSLPPSLPPPFSSLPFV
jgi:hypothetical protein